MHVGKRAMAVAVAVGLLAVAVAANPAGAEGSGQTVTIGDTRCTDYVQSDNGAVATIYVASGTAGWTVRRSTSMGGTETVVAQGLAGSLTQPPQQFDRVVPPTAPGAFLYRLCLVITKSAKPGFFPLANYRISITSTSPNAVTDIGPETAVMTQYAQACGDRTAVPPGATVRLTGAGSVPVHWSINVTGNTNNYEGPWYAFLGDASTIDETVVLDPEVTHVTACAAHATITPNLLTVSYELSLA